MRLLWAKHLNVSQVWSLHTAVRQILLFSESKPHREYIICSMICRRLIFINNTVLEGKFDINLEKLVRIRGLLTFYMQIEDTEWVLRVYAVGMLVSSHSEICQRCKRN